MGRMGRVSCSACEHFIKNGKCAKNKPRVWFDNEDFCEHYVYRSNKCAYCNTQTHSKYAVCNNCKAKLKLIRTIKSGLL